MRDLRQSAVSDKLSGNLNTGAALASVPFHGDTIEATGDGEWAIVKRICENLGVAEQRQSAKLKAKAWATTTLRVAVAEDGKEREVFCIHRNSLAMWLATIEASKVRPEIREKLLAYQREAADVLAAHFQGAQRVAVVANDSSIANALASLASSFAAMAATQQMVVANQATLSQTVDRLMAGASDERSGRSFAAIVSDKVRIYAEYQCDGSPKAMKVWRGRGHRFLRGLMGFHAPWPFLPAHRRPDAVIHMDELIRGAKQSAAATTGKAQLSLVPTEASR